MNEIQHVHAKLTALSQKHVHLLIVHATITSKHEDSIKLACVQAGNTFARSNIIMTTISWIGIGRQQLQA